MSGLQQQLPSARALLTELFSSLPTTQATGHDKAGIKNNNSTNNKHGRNSSSDSRSGTILNPLRNLRPGAQRDVFLTLHVLFPNELLPALDLLDRRLVTRVEVIAATQQQQPGSAPPTAAEAAARGGPTGEAKPSGPAARARGEAETQSTPEQQRQPGSGDHIIDQEDKAAVAAADEQTSPSSRGHGARRRQAPNGNGNNLLSSTVSSNNNDARRRGAAATDKNSTATDATGSIAAVVRSAAARHQPEDGIAADATVPAASISGHGKVLLSEGGTDGGRDDDAMDGGSLPAAVDAFADATAARCQGQGQGQGRRGQGLEDEAAVAGIAGQIQGMPFDAAITSSSSTKSSVTVAGGSRKDDAAAARNPTASSRKNGRDGGQTTTTTTQSQAPLARSGNSGGLAAVAPLSPRRSQTLARPGDGASADDDDASACCNGHDDDGDEDEGQGQRRGGGGSRNSVAKHVESTAESGLHHLEHQEEQNDNTTPDPDPHPAPHATGPPAATEAATAKTPRPPPPPKHHTQDPQAPQETQVIFYVRSASTINASAASSDARTHHHPYSHTYRSQQQQQQQMHDIPVYEVRLAAWHCTCPAFAFAAFPAATTAGSSASASVPASVPASPSSTHEDEDGQRQHSFGGLLLLPPRSNRSSAREAQAGSTDAIEPEPLPPVCKHLLACLLVECAPGLFGLGVDGQSGGDDGSGLVLRRRVAPAEAAGLAAGWGGL